MAAKKHPPVTLIAGGKWTRDFGTAPYLHEALSASGEKEPLVVQIGAANGDDRAFGWATVKLLQKAGAGEVLWPRVTGRRKDPAAMRDALKKAHVVFVSGGDVEEGMRVLAELDLVGPVRAAARRGAVCVGISAGAIMLGERWIRWPHAKATDDEAETFECLEIAPVTIDTHGEKDGWGEVRSFVAVRAVETRKPALAWGIPSGGCLRVTREGDVTAIGYPAQAFRAKPGAPAEALPDVPIAR